jgi:phospholipid/cholesterol/gamma-HCH transport system substrate-binding protein
MAARTADHIRLGLFVLVGSLLLVVGLYLLGSKRDLFQRTVRVEVRFQQVSGLRPGNNVRYAGITVGTVKDIRIESDTSVLVTLAIRTADAGHIREDAVASLGSDGLMGNRLVNISAGDGHAGPIADGSVLRSSMPLDTDLMMRTLDRTNVNMAEITDDLRQLSDRINRPGSLVMLLGDTVLAAQVRASLTDLQGSVQHVRSVAANVDAVMGDVRDGRGAMGVLVSDPAAEAQVRQWLLTMQQLADSLAHATAQIDQFAVAMNTSGSLGHTIARDTAVAGDVRRTVQQLERSSGVLEENLRALQRNWLFRRYFREKEKEERRSTK